MSCEEESPPPERSASLQRFVELAFWAEALASNAGVNLSISRSYGVILEAERKIARERCQPISYDSVERRAALGPEPRTRIPSGAR